VDKIKAIECLVLTEAFFTISREFIGRFKSAKHIRRGLDFNDQIILVLQNIRERFLLSGMKSNLSIPFKGLNRSGL